jgi:hypothetical protein
MTLSLTPALSQWARVTGSALRATFVAKAGLNHDSVSVVACPVDYSENTKLTDRLGSLTQAL